MEVEATLRPEGETEPFTGRPLRSGESPMFPALAERCSGRPSRSASAAAVLSWCLSQG